MTGLPARIGRYDITGRLGGGGMGVVYKAHDPQIGRDVAIKQIREELDSQDLRDRMLREVRATGRLRHPNIVSTFDIGDHDGFPFIVMELVEGRTLDAMITAGDLLPLRTRLDLMAQLCAGLGAAHDAGIIHRDVKPANLIVDAAGTLKIVDFGIARMTASGTGTMAIGTANYMSPEQWTGHGVDIRTDIFAAGAVFYELLAGRRAFPGKSLPEICQRVMNEPPVPLETLCDGLDPQIVQIVNRMLDKTPANRFESLTPVRAQLQDLHARLTKAEEGAYAATIRMRRDELLAAATAAAVPEEPGIDLAAVGRRRTTQIETHMKIARAAFERGDLQQAAASCEDVLVLDPSQTAALDLLKQVRRLQTHGTAEKPPAVTPIPPVAPAPVQAAQPAPIPAPQPVPVAAQAAAVQQPASPPAAHVSPATPPAKNLRPMLVGGAALAAVAILAVFLMLRPEPPARPAPVISAPQTAASNATPPPQPTAPQATPPPAAVPAAPVPAPAPVPATTADASRSAAPQRTPAQSRVTPAPPPPAPVAPVRVGGSIAQPRRTKGVAPTYPAAAQAARVQGVVILEATIDTSGKVQDAKILRSIPLLDTAALDAVKQWEYTPTLLNGVPVPVIMTVTVNFELKSNPKVEGLDPDGVMKLLGPPSSTQADYSGGIRIWYYDRPEGTLTVYFKNDRASLRRPQ